MIVNSLGLYPVRVQTLPSIYDLALGKIKIEDIRDVGIEDLLGRDTVEPKRESFTCKYKKQIGFGN